VFEVTKRLKYQERTGDRYYWLILDKHLIIRHFVLQLPFLYSGLPSDHDVP